VRCCYTASRCLQSTYLAVLRRWAALEGSGAHQLPQLHTQLTAVGEALSALPDRDGTDGTAGYASRL